MESIEFQSEVARTQAARTEKESAVRTCGPATEAPQSCERRSLLSYQKLSAKQLAMRLNVPRTWINDNSKEGCTDPIPYLPLGKYKRYLWRSPELAAWIERRIVSEDSIDSSSPSQRDAEYDFLDSAELAALLNVPETWVRDQVRSRASEPIPHLRFGKYVRFRWGSPELEKWAESRMLSSNNRVVSRAGRKEFVQ